MCLFFGFYTTFFIFNLFVEVLHLILESYLYFPVDYCLDDFIITISTTKAKPVFLTQYNKPYIELTNILKVPCQESTNEMGTIISVFRIQIDTNLFKASLPADKIRKSIFVTATALLKRFFSLKEA